MHDHDQPHDKIHIRGLRLRTKIGVADWEKKAPQDIVVEMTIHHDQTAAAASDELADTVSYKALRDRVVAFVEDAHHELLETLSERLAALALEDPKVQAVDVTIDKPGALRFADSVAVTIHRRQGRAVGAMEEA